MTSEGTRRAWPCKCVVLAEHKPCGGMSCRLSWAGPMLGHFGVLAASALHSARSRAVAPCRGQDTALRRACAKARHLASVSRGQTAAQPSWLWPRRVSAPTHVDSAHDPG